MVDATLMVAWGKASPLDPAAMVVATGATLFPVVIVPLPPEHPVNFVGVMPVYVTATTPAVVRTRIVPAYGNPTVEATLISACGSTRPFDPTAMVVLVGVAEGA